MFQLRRKAWRWFRADIVSNGNARQALSDLLIRVCAEESVYAELEYV